MREPDKLGPVSRCDTGLLCVIPIGSAEDVGAKMYDLAQIKKNADKIRMQRITQPA
jgi:hypothetical protein